MSQILKLRDYQRDAIAAIHQDWADGVRRTAAVLPTGAGKTVVFAHLIKKWRAENRSRVLVLAHRDELVNQAADKIRAIAPHLSVGIVKAERHEVNRDAIVASVQTLRSPARRERIYDVGLVIVDECHHATAPTYRAILEHFGCFGPEGAGTRLGDWQGSREPRSALAAGFTATLMRSDGAALGDVWEHVAYRLDILKMIRRGWLLDVRGKRVEVSGLDLDKVKRVHGDFQDRAMGEALSASLAPEAVAKSYLEHASDRSGVLFAPTVESAYQFAAALNDAGVKTETVHGKLAPGERREIFARAHDGTTQVVSNCMVATEGTDVPRWSCAVIARPTQSAPLYVQMVGRVLRPFPGQTDALVLDVVGVTSKHKLRSLVDLSGREFHEEMEEGESLLDHEDADELLELQLAEAEAAGEGIPVEYVNGPTVARDVDLFAESRQQWLQTDAGHWFVSAGEEHLVFLAPGVLPGMYDVCWAHKDKRKGGYTEHINVELEYAMAWAEDVASEYPGFETYASKTASWRRGKKPTLLQKNYAKNLGIIFDDETTKSELGNRITQCVASRRIDAIVKAMGRA